MAFPHVSPERNERLLGSRSGTMGWARTDAGGVTRLEFLLQKEQDAPGTMLVMKEGSEDVIAAMVPQTSRKNGLQRREMD